MIISFVVAFLAIILTFVCSGAFASLLMTVFVFVSGQLLCRTIGRENRDRGRLLFNIVFSCLTVFACIHYMDTVVDWQAFALDWNDEYKFWKLSETLSGYLSVKSIFVDCFINRNVGGLIENQGYVFYIGILAYIAETFLDGNNLLCQFMGSVLFGSLFSIVLYKIFLLYIDGKKAFKYVLIFSLCSVVFSYGFLFLRDVVILFFLCIDSIYRSAKIHRSQFGRIDSSVIYRLSIARRTWIVFHSIHSLLYLQGIQENQGFGLVASPLFACRFLCIFRNIFR